MAMTPEDAEILQRGHGGYRIDTRFRERWTVVSAPSDPDPTPEVEDAALVHPYLQRITARHWTIEKAWAIRVRPGATSVDDPARLTYSFVNETRDTHEAVVIDDVDQFTRWVKAALRERSG